MGKQHQYVYCAGTRLRPVSTGLLPSDIGVAMQPYIYPVDHAPYGLENGGNAHHTHHRVRSRLVCRDDVKLPRHCGGLLPELPLLHLSRWRVRGSSAPTGSYQRTTRRSCAATSLCHGTRALAVNSRKTCWHSVGGQQRQVQTVSPGMTPMASIMRALLHSGGV